MSLLENLRSKVEQHFTIPDHIPQQYRRWYGLSFLLYPAGFIIHFFFIGLFYVIGEKELMLFNIGSCILFLFITRITYLGYLFTGVFIANVEVLAHASFATLVLGWESGFHYLILVVPPAIFLAPKDKDWFKYTIVAFNMVVYLGTYFLAHQDQKLPFEMQLMNVANILTLFVLLALVGFGYSVGAARAEKTIHLAHEKSKKLLHNILPTKIANKLTDDDQTIAESYEETSVMFIDLVGFTKMFRQYKAEELVGLLNQIFSMIDDLVAKYRLEKIKTIGDAYMIASGVPSKRSDHAEAICHLALELSDKLNIFNIEKNMNIEFRIGINSGSVIAGVIGKNKFIYDLWGDSVNIASRMESQGSPGRIQVGPKTYEALKDSFHFEHRGTIRVKGIGEVETYYLVGHQARAREDDWIDFDSVGT